MNVLAVLLNVLISVNEIFWLYQWVNVIAEKKRPMKFLEPVLYMVYVVTVLSLNQIALTSPYTMAVIIVQNFLAVLIFWKSDLIQVFAAIGGYFAAMFVIGNIEISLTGMIGGEELIAATTSEQGVERVLYLLIFGSLWLFLNKYLVSYIRKKNISRKSIGVLFLCGIQFFILGKVQQNLNIFYEKIPVTMRRSAYYENIAADYKPLKEIQIYGAKGLILDKLKKAHQDNVDLFSTSFSKNGKYEGLMGIITQVQLVFVYAYNVINLFLNKISLGDFTLFVSAASKFAENILVIAKDLVIIHQDCRYLDVYLQFMDIKSESEKGEEHIPVDQIFEIEFRNVSFRYPNQKEKVLENVSVTIRPGERISIVGMNGAGKTTFVKLLSRLLIPTEGGIYLNGININRYCVEEYRNLISSVFQDFKIFSFSIKDNIDINRSGGDVGEAIRRAGLESWVKGCPAGEKTQVTKRFYEEGVEPSGGEAQKMAIARAVFKDSPIIVLDEPTAALDPYAEYEIYRSFDEISKGKTVIYISHRLGYCLLSDRILVFEKGKIVEQGTHEKLKMEGGIYTKLWNAQAKYYTS